MIIVYTQNWEFESGETIIVVSLSSWKTKILYTYPSKEDLNMGNWEMKTLRWKTDKGGKGKYIWGKTDREITEN